MSVREFTVMISDLWSFVKSVEFVFIEFWFAVRNAHEIQLKCIEVVRN